LVGSGERLVCLPSGVGATSTTTPAAGSCASGGERGRRTTHHCVASCLTAAGVACGASIALSDAYAGYVKPTM
jgi:hypothetical protein